ncbi:MAG: DUF4342 domain-containing protein [Lachnospiraceae bacterium]|nr:DUF4342 domain-containing protein [Lachnospiraceae bacterium]
MDNLEKVERIREKTGVSYEDAKVALEASNNDMLDAIVYLEKLGKVNAPKQSQYITRPEEYHSSEFQQAQENYEKSCKKSTFGEKVDNFGDWFKRVIKRSCEIKFNVDRYEERVFSLPLLALIIIMIVAFWLVGILLIVGLFFDYKYSFEGVNPTTVDINDLCNKASDTCTSLREDIKNEKNDIK